MPQASTTSNASESSSKTHAADRCTAYNITNPPILSHHPTAEVSTPHHNPHRRRPYHHNLGTTATWADQPTNPTHTLPPQSVHLTLTAPWARPTCTTTVSKPPSSVYSSIPSRRNINSNGDSTSKGGPTSEGGRRCNAPAFTTIAIPTYDAHNPT